MFEMLQMKKDHVFDFEANEFGCHSVLGNIHSKTVYERLERLGGHEELVEWLKFGVKFKIREDCADFTKLEEGTNNRSLQENLEKAQEIILNWEKEGYVKRCSKEDLDVINPLSMKFKYYNVAGKTKPRLCLDCNKVSKLLEYPSLKLPEALHMKEYLKKEDWMFSTDYTRYYFHFRLHR